MFRAEISREGLVRGRLLQLADQLTDGLTSPLVHALVKERGLSPGEIEEFRRLVEVGRAPSSELRAARSRAASAKARLEMLEEILASVR